jgi:hypothetical protein
MIAQSTHKHAIGKHILFFPHVQYIFVFYFHDAHDVIIIHEKCSYFFLNGCRSYYRCTHQGCNVKKQVQRLAKDEDVVVTTYDGTHTHPILMSNDNFENILTRMHIYSSIGGSGFSGSPTFP